jgi:hypothetical protein
MRRTRLLTVQAEHKELEVAALHRSLLPFDEVVAAWEQLVAAFPARCLALPSKLAPRLAVIHERRKVQEALTAQIREALQELSQFDLADSPRRKSPAGSNGKSRQRRARAIRIH